MEPDDILAYHVKIGGPILAEFRAAAFRLAKTDARQVSGKGVVPDVEHLLGIVRPGYTPLDPLAADGNIAQTAFHETLHFVTAKVWLHELGMLLVKLQQAVLESREFEEVIALADQLTRTAADGAISRFGALGDIQLVENTVAALVMAFVDVPGALRREQHALHRHGVVRAVGINEVRVTDIQQLPELLDLGAFFRNESGGTHAGLIRRALKLFTVLVGACQKRDIITAQPLVACESVANEGGVGVSGVQPGIGIVERSCEIKFGHSRSSVIN